MIDNAELIQDVLDIVVLERRDGEWRCSYPFPAWFTSSLLAQPRSGMANTFEYDDVTCPFFDHLLSEALAVNGDEENEAQLTEIWSQDAADGEELFFAADVRTWRNTLIVLVRKLGAEFQRRTSRMQAAREELLTSERLEAEVFRRTRAIREREEEIALRLLAASNAHDYETGAHVRRIGLYSAAMARALGWTDERVADMRVAAPMHDVGKIGIPDRILKKPGRLAGEEWDVMRTHTNIGADILASESVPLLQLASEIARYHHENYDGSGYPLGLEREEIPISARIVTIVDVYDALVHRRVYKPAFEEPEVIRHMRELAGTRFDPGLLHVFFDILPVMRKIRLENPDEPHTDEEQTEEPHPASRRSAGR